MRTAKLGFLGLGTMGAGMVGNLLRAGYEVAGYNRTPARSEPLTALGMQPVKRPGDVAVRSDIVFLCVSNDAAVRSLALGNPGVIEQMDQGSVLVDTGTTGLELTSELAECCARRDVRFVDAPITGSKLGARNGTLTFIVGGSSDDVAALQPFFEVMGKHVVHVGEQIGSGQRAKYCLNMTQAVVLQGVLEGYTLANKLGIGMDKLAEVFENSAGKTGVGSFKTPYLFRGDYTPHFRLALMHKDLHLALAEAAKARVPLPAASATCHVYDQGTAEGLGEEDFLALAKLMERWAKISFRTPC